MERRLHIRELRQSAGLTQEVLAARLELHSAATISMWESGKRRPRAGMLPRLAYELGCTVGELITEKEADAQ